MDKLIEKIENLVESYDSVLKERENDEWLKGYVSGLLHAKQEAIVLMNDTHYIDKEKLLKWLNDKFDKLMKEHYDVKTLEQVQQIIYKVKSM